MGELSEIGWGFGIFVSGCLFAAGWGVVTYSPEFRIARLLFLFVPLPLIIADVIWVRASSLSISERLLITAVIGAVLAFGTEELLHWLECKEKAAKKKIRKE